MVLLVFVVSKIMGVFLNFGNVCIVWVSLILFMFGIFKFDKIRFGFSIFNIVSVCFVLCML